MGKMYKSVGFFAAFNERTGYGQHATCFVKELEKLVPVNRNAEGEVNISLLDVVTAAHTTVSRPYPSILYTVWESTEYPVEFLDKLCLYDQMWVTTEWERACGIAQGIPEEFIKVVHEGVDPEIFKPEASGIDETRKEFHFNFLHVGQWQPRKSTLEICQAFLKAFPFDIDSYPADILHPKYEDVCLYLLADTLFPSDTYKSTEERLQANGIADSRIIPIHFEERDQYIRRLQSAHVFVSCSRAEGWGLPIIESMAVGVPTIVANWSGPTEYAGDALLVRVPELRKPHGIFGNWDVPGKWGEPDYNHLVEVMRDSYENYATHKAAALKTSNWIRSEFSWEKAAKKAYAVLEELSAKPESRIEIREAPKVDIKHNACFLVDCWPSNQDKLDTLAESIDQIHSFGIPVLLTSHFPLPPSIIQKAEYYLYEKRDIMSGDDKPIYWRTRLDGTTENKRCNVEYQGVAALNCARNAIDFLKNKYDWLYQMSSDMELDMADWLSKVQASPKPMVFMAYEGIKNGVGGGLWAATSEMADKVFPVVNSWEEYAVRFPDVRFVVERWLYNHIAAMVNIDETIHWIECDTRNRYDNVDRTVWTDDEFQCHFVGGPTLNVVGVSCNEYDVTFANPQDGIDYALKQKAGIISTANKKYYRDWEIRASLNGEVKFEHKMDLAGKRVLISSGSKALGDTLAWVPYVEEFRKRHNCHVLFSSWWNHIIDYPEIEFILPGTMAENIYASYEVGCFDCQPDKHPFDWRTVPLQKVASDQLGLDYKPIPAKLKYTPYRPAGNGHAPKPYMCFSEFSTMQNKMWNREGAWQNVIDYATALGFDCVSISVEQTGLKNVISHNGQPIEQTLADLSGSFFYLGLNHGPLWLAYSLGVPTVLLTGVSEPFNDPPVFARIQVDSCRKGCFNDPSIPIGRSWDWCPRNRNFACTRDITEAMVIAQIDRLLGIGKFQKTYIQEVQEARL